MPHCLRRIPTFQAPVFYVGINVGKDFIMGVMSLFMSLPLFTALVLIVHAGRATLLTQEGVVRVVSLSEATDCVQKQKDVLVCHAPATAARLGLSKIPGVLDILELYAFVRPALPCVPSPLGLARVLDLALPQELEDGPITLLDAARILLQEVQQKDLAVVGAMGPQWPWREPIFAALGAEKDTDLPPDPRAFAVWDNLPDWTSDPPGRPPDSLERPLTEKEATQALTRTLPEGSKDRPGQRDYAAFMAGVFASPRADGAPHLLIAEGGTGTGKTLAYLAPAAAWADQAGAPVWVSTYTKALQRQISHALQILWPDPKEREAKTATRKGRENTLCLLSLEELAASPRHAVAAGLMSRWAQKSGDGDLSGAFFPGWLPLLLGFAGTLGLADRRGECIYAACPHFKKCFIERSTRRAEKADIVVANHALTMARTAIAAPDDSMPRRYIFDEGHHLFEAADSAFALRLTGKEMADIRRWILGAESTSSPRLGRSRRRGLARRTEGLIEGDEAAVDALKALLRAAKSLPQDTWAQRLTSKRDAHGPGEDFLAACLAQIEAYEVKEHIGPAPFGREAPAFPASLGLQGAAKALCSALEALERPIKTLTVRLCALLSNPEGVALEADTRSQIESLARALTFRVEYYLTPWRHALTSIFSPLAGGGEEGACLEEDSEFCTLLIAEAQGQNGDLTDLGLARHYIDPMRPFAKAIAQHADGIAVTSATMRDGAGEAAWGMARLRSGALWLAPHHVRTAAFPSPFAYNDCARVFVVTDIDRTDMGAVAAAYRALFLASRGGALGLFTAISRLRAVYARIASVLEEEGLCLYAQHVDAMDVGTLLDLFRAEENACLLGTDAVRDGVDVPGRALRLLVMDRVPWPRPDLLHKARRAAFGGRVWDDAITRLRLTQAFGRLIRQERDKGVFILLDPRLPRRLEDAFPQGVSIERVCMADALHSVSSFL